MGSNVLGDPVSPFRLSGTRFQTGYSDPPDDETDGTAIIYGVSLLSEENTTAMMVSNGKSELEDYEGDFSTLSQAPHAYRNIHENELRFDYRKTQFKFKWQSGVDPEAKFPIRYFVLFIPEDDPDTEENEEETGLEIVDTIEWDGVNEDEIFEIDPVKLKPGEDGRYELLKMDVVAHVPAELVDSDNNLKTGAEIPAEDEDTASNLQIVVNDDNDRRRSYDAASYPKDMDLVDIFSEYEDDLVAVVFQFPEDINTGTLEISANVNATNPEARAFFLTTATLNGSPIPPTKELVTLNPATTIDLSSASNADLLWELANEGEQTLYVEGLAAKDDLEIKLSFKVNGTETGSESVHMKILSSTERKLKVLSYPGKGWHAMHHMNDSDNSLRKDDDGYENAADRVTPIAFRQDGAVSSANVHDSWRFVNIGNSFQTNAIYNELIQQGRNLYICEDLDHGAGWSRGGDEIMILGKPRLRGGSLQAQVPKWTLAHEWLHAFKDLRHVNVTNDIMWGTVPPPLEVDLNNNGELDANETMVEEGPHGYINQNHYNLLIN